MNRPATIQPVRSARNDRIRSRPRRLVYLLQALSFVLGVTSVIGVVVNYLRLADAGNLARIPFRLADPNLLVSAVVGPRRSGDQRVPDRLPDLGRRVFLDLYRVVKGWLNLADERPMYAD
jgi:uncharacterized membrane protein